LIPIYYRAQPLSFKNRNIILDDIIDEITSNTANTDINTINKQALNNIMNEYNNYLQLLNNVIVDNGIKIGENVYNAIIAMILDRLNMKDLLNVTYNVMELYFKSKQSEFKNNKVAPYVLNYLKEKDILLIKTKLLVDSKIDMYKTGDYIGFILDEKYYCYTKEHLDICDNVLQQKIAYIRELSIKKPTKVSYRDIVGYYINDAVKKNEFKIIHTSSKKPIKNILTSGRSCITYKMEDLLEVMKLIGMKKPAFSKKVKRDNICIEIEFLLRYFEMVKKGGETWFVSNRKV